MNDVIIIGAGAAGLTAAIYCTRAGLSTLVFDKNIYGGQVSITSEIENYPALEKITGSEFAERIYKQAVQMGAQVEFEEVISFDFSGEIKRIATPTGERECRAVILATGAQRRKLGCPGEQELTGRGVSYCATCDGAFFRGKTAVVVGGGNTALEDALYLSGICKEVTLIHRRDRFRGEKRLSERLAQKDNCRVIWNSAVEKILGEQRVTGIQIKDTQTGDLSSLDTDAVFVAIGLNPDTGIFKDALQLDPAGYIAAGEDCKTNLPGVFVAGDNRSKPLRQIITAAADGAVAASQAIALVNEDDPAPRARD